ncbi:MAG: HD domain-containing protein [Nocardioidaceae bacterium]
MPGHHTDLAPGHVVIVTRSVFTWGGRQPRRRPSHGNKLGPLTLRHSCRVRAAEAPDRDDSLTHGLDARLQAQLTFLVEVDHLKTVLRQSPLAADQRRENDAEHSWHLAMMVTILAEHSDEPIDVGHATQLVLVHDLIEIYRRRHPSLR